MLTSLQKQILLLSVSYLMIFVIAISLGKVYEIYQITSNKESVLKDINEYEVVKSSSGDSLYPTEYWVSWIAIIGLLLCTGFSTWGIVNTHDAPTGLMGKLTSMVPKK
jgi:Na+/proline symporter